MRKLLFGMLVLCLLSSVAFYEVAYASPNYNLFANNVTPAGESATENSDDYYSSYLNQNPYTNQTPDSGSDAVYVGNDPENSQATLQAAAPASPFIIAGLGIGFLALVPLNWKILKHYH
jgi:hypothetical protein